MLTLIALITKGDVVEANEQLAITPVMLQIAR